MEYRRVPWGTSLPRELILVPCSQHHKCAINQMHLEASGRISLSFVSFDISGSRKASDSRRQTLFRGSRNSQGG